MPVVLFNAPMVFDPAASYMFGLSRKLGLLDVSNSYM